MKELLPWVALLPVFIGSHFSAYFTGKGRGYREALTDIRTIKEARERGERAAALEQSGEGEKP